MAKRKRSMSVSEMASLGGKASAASLTPEQRSHRAKVAAHTRWSKKTKVNNGKNT